MDVPAYAGPWEGVRDLSHVSQRLVDRLGLQQPRAVLAGTHAKPTQQSNVWSYQFDWAQQPAPWADVYGAAHGFDLPFWFGNSGPSLLAKAANSAANQPGRLALPKAMMNSVRACMRSCTPATRTTPA